MGEKHRASASCNCWTISPHKRSPNARGGGQSVWRWIPFKYILPDTDDILLFLDYCSRILLVFRFTFQPPCPFSGFCFASLLELKLAQGEQKDDFFKIYIIVFFHFWNALSTPKYSKVPFGERKPPFKNQCSRESSDIKVWLWNFPVANELTINSERGINKILKNLYYIVFFSCIWLRFDRYYDILYCVWRELHLTILLLHY